MTRELIAEASGKDQNGQLQRVTVYRDTGGFILRGGQMGSYQHRCPHAQTFDHVKAEIRTVFEFDVTDWKTAFDIRNDMNKGRS